MTLIDAWQRLGLRVQYGNGKENNKIIALFNFSTEHHNFTITDDVLSGNYINFFTREEISLEDKEEFTLNAWEYLVFVKNE